ncbi:hypothetical protein HPP92_016757 [Vanilla planifolia]|uniref:Uncharacterized protein n=1 Tax=Vanilla planifolia TaxID=51239 RepID=A0A835QJG8_VANPL|nr:hypothetical protein HPP92_016757 [Vanilla planifolia]
MAVVSIKGGSFRVIVLVEEEGNIELDPAGPWTSLWFSQPPRANMDSTTTRDSPSNPNGKRKKPKPTTSWGGQSLIPLPTP